MKDLEVLPLPYFMSMYYALCIRYFVVRTVVYSLGWPVNAGSDLCC